MNRSRPLTRFQAFTVVAEAYTSGSVPLIRQLLCSTLCSEFLNYRDPPQMTELTIISANSNGR